MIVAVTSVTLFEVPDDHPDAIAARFRAANEVAIGQPMTTITGQRYVHRGVDSLTLEVRRPTPPVEFCTHEWIEWRVEPDASDLLHTHYVTTCPHCWATRGGAKTLAQTFREQLLGGHPLGKQRDG